jgi:RNA polymerase sigma factor (TIGR02999 family)
MNPRAVDAHGAEKTGEITSLLRRWRAGDKSAIDNLAPLVYDELRRLARSALRGRSGAQTLQPTALVNELFLRLLGRPAIQVEDRHHFFALAAKLLRQVLVDQARARAAQKRGGGALTVEASAAELAESATAPPAVDLLDLECALEKLRAREPQVERLVELRFFAGLTIEEAAVVMARSKASLSRDWALARAFLFRELHRAPAAL